MARQEALFNAEVPKYRRSVFALNTQLAYKSQLRVFLCFCLFFGYLAIPAATQTIVRYCVFLARHHTASSVRQYLNVIRILHLSNGLPNPLESNFAVHSILRGTDRIRSHVPKRKLPRTPRLLIMFYDKLDFKSEVDITFFAALWGFSLSSGNLCYHPPRFPGTNTNIINVGEMFHFPMMVYAYHFDTQKLSNAMSVY